jgi:hypothetical protein
MFALRLHDRRFLSDRRILLDRRAAAVQVAPRATPTVVRRLSRRRLWTALTLYSAAFWGLVGYAIFDIFAR